MTMTNKKEKSDFWRMLDEEIANHNAIQNGTKKQSSVMYFSNKSHQLFEMYSEGKITRIKLNLSMTTLTQECEEMYQDEMESAIIKQCAEQSTSNASTYAEGYSAGYERALKLIKWQIEHILPPAKESINKKP